MDLIRFIDDSVVADFSGPPCTRELENTEPENIDDHAEKDRTISM